MLNTSNNGVVLMIPFPLQYEDMDGEDMDGDSEEEPDESNVRADTAKIAEHYKLLGYSALGYQSVHGGGAAEFVGKWNALLHPRLGAVVPGLSKRW